MQNLLQEDMKMKITRIEPQRNGTFILEDSEGNEYIKEQCEINMEEYRKIAGGNPDGDLEKILNA